LAIETSSLPGTVAVSEDDRCLGQTELPPQQRTAQSLAPAIAALLTNVRWQPHDVQLFAVTVGPGSFTGLRIAVTTVKTFAYAVGAEVIGLNTLQVIAAQAPADQQNIWAVMDAQRQQLFCGLFRRSDSGLETVRDTTIIDRDSLSTLLDGNCAVTGPGLRSLQSRLPAGVFVVEQPLWTPQARTVAAIGYQAYCAGRRDNLWQLTPRYYRQSAAEEKLQRKD
jgi:tRNA threonylcarbamoyladenosine biosynthesis protein TsaB